MFAGLLETLAWKEPSLPPDSSSSETGKDTPPEVQFTLGDDDPPVTTTVVKPPIKEISGMTRSFSQDTNISYDDTKITGALSKTSLSENSLENSERKRRKHIKELTTVMSMDDETLSTDSNSTADNDELRRRRRTIFPGFRKNKGKST